MASTYNTGILITGDAQGGVNAIRLTRNELGSLNDQQGVTRKEADKTKSSIGRLIGKFTVITGAIGATIGSLALLGAGLRTNAIREMTLTAEAVNMSTSALTEWTYAAQKQGLEADKMGDIFKDVQEKIGDFIATGGGEGADIFKNLGISVDELKKKSPDEQLLRIAAGLDQVATTGEKIFYLESLASDASRLLPILENGAKGLKAAQKEARLLGLSLDQIEAEKVAQAGEEIGRLKGLFTGASNELTIALAPALTAVNQKIVDGALELGGWQNTFGTLVDFTISGLGVLVDNAHRVHKVLKLIEIGWLAIGSAGLNVLSGISDTTADVLNAVLIPFKKIIADIADGLAMALGPIADYLGDSGLKAMAKDLATFTEKTRDFKISADDIVNASSAINARLAESQADFERLRNIEPGNELASWWDDVKKSADDAAKAQAKAKAETRKNAQSSTGTVLTKKDLDAAKKLQDELKKSATQFDSLIDKSLSFGEQLNIAGDSVISSFGSVAQQLDNMIAKQNELGKLEKELAREREKQSFEYFSGLIDGESDRANRAEKNLKLIEKAEENLADSRLQSNASSFAGMANAAGQFFDEQSSARENLHKIETAFTIVETALALKKAATTALAAIANQGSGDPYTAFARIAAMAGLMAGLGLFSGSASGSAPPSSEQRQKTQGTGTVLGDMTAKSESLQNTFDRIEELSLDQYAELKEINRSIKDLNSAIINMAARLAGRYGRFDESTYGGELGSHSHTDTNGLFAEIGSKTGAFLGDPLGELLDGIVGSFSKTKKSLEDSGIKFFSQTMQSIIESGMVEAAAYFDVKTKKSSWWGLSSKTNYDTTYEDIDTNLQREFALIFTNVGDSLTQSLEILGIDAEQSLNNFVIDISNISLKDLSGDDLEAELQAVFSAQADKMAQWLTSGVSTIIDTSPPRWRDDLYDESYYTRQVDESWLTDFQKMGEGLSDTLMRLAQEQAVFNQALELTGQSLQGLSGIMRVEVSQSIIELIGGVEKLNDASTSYFQNFFSESEQRAQLEQQLTSHMESLNVAMPKTKEGFKNLISGLDLTTDEGKALYAALLPLNDSFAQLFDSAQLAQQRIEELIGGWQEQLQRFGLDGEELELFDLEIWYQEQKQQAEEGGADISLLTELYNKRKLEIEQRYADLSIEESQRLADEQRSILQAQIDEQIETLEASRLTVQEKLSGVADVFAELASNIASVVNNINNTQLSIRKTGKNWSESDYIAGEIASAYELMGTGSINEQINNVDSLQNLIQQRYDLERSKNDELISQIEQQKSASLSAYNEQLRAYEQMAASIKSGIEQIRDSADTMLASEKSPLKLSEQLGETEAIYERTLKEARAGDTAAMGNLTKIRDKYLEQSSTYYGSGSQEYKALFDELYRESKNFNARVPTSPPPHPDVSKWQSQIADIEQRNSELQESSLKELDSLQLILLAMEKQASLDAESQKESLQEELEKLNDQLTELQTHSDALLTEQTVALVDQSEQTNKLLEQVNNSSVVHLQKVDDAQEQADRLSMLQIESQASGVANVINAVNAFNKSNTASNERIINQLEGINARLSAVEHAQSQAVQLASQANKQRQSNNDLLNQTNRKLTNQRSQGAIA